MMAIDVEWLIFEIRTRPIIWDHRISDYTDKIKKDASWRDIARAMNENFDILDVMEQNRIVVDLQEKWTNVRSYFCKELRLVKSQNGDSAKKRKKYMFFDQLNFLEGVVKQRNKSSKDISLEEVNMLTEGGECSIVSASSSPECCLITATPNAESGVIATKPSSESGVSAATPSSRSRVMTSTPNAEFSVNTATPNDSSHVMAATPSSEFSANAATPNARSRVLAATPNDRSRVLAATPIAEFSVNSATPNARSRVMATTPVAEFSVNAATINATSRIRAATPSAENKVNGATLNTKALKLKTEIEESLLTFLKYNDVKNQDGDFLFLCSLYKDFKQVREENKYAVKVSIMNSIEIGKRNNRNPAFAQPPMYNNHNIGNFPPGPQFPPFYFLF